MRKKVYAVIRSSNGGSVSGQFTRTSLETWAGYPDTRKIVVTEKGRTRELNLESLRKKIASSEIAEEAPKVPTPPMEHVPHYKEEERF